jgi:hypothetical protein
MGVLLAVLILTWVVPALAETPPPAPPTDKVARLGQPGWTVDQSTGCWIWNTYPGVNATVRWSGGCGRDGPANGRGILEWRYRDGTERYEGELRDGKLHGQGVYVWADGDQYEGDLQNGKMHGRGVYTNSGGDRYEGEWRDNRPHGSGEARINDLLLSGTWSEGCIRKDRRVAAWGRPIEECP